MTPKTYTNGQVLYSENMDDLVLSTAMRFPDAATRTAILKGALAPTNGMLTATVDDSSTARWITQGGTPRWQPTSPQVMFSYAATAVQMIPAAQQSYVTGWNVNLLGSRNVGNFFNPSSGQFKTTYAGWFEFVGGVVSPFVGADFHVGLYMNTGTGAAVDYSRASRAVGPNPSPSASTSMMSIVVAILPTYLTYLSVYSALPSGSDSINAQTDIPGYFSAKFLGGF
jgi:hypothetical protein